MRGRLRLHWAGAAHGQGQYFQGRRHKGNGDDCFVIYLKRYNNITILTFSSSFVPMIKLPFKLLPSVVLTSLFQTLSFFFLFILGFKTFVNLVHNLPWHVNYIIHSLFCTIWYVLFCYCVHVMKYFVAYFFVP